MNLVPLVLMWLLHFKFENLMMLHEHTIVITIIDY